MRTLCRVTLVVALAASVSAQPAQAATTGYVFTYGTTYMPGDNNGAVNAPLVHLAGNDLLFTNLHLPEGHSVTSLDFKPGTYERLFDSGQRNFGEQAVVAGVAELPPGTYAFTCSVHGTMSGSITII